MRKVRKSSMGEVYGVSDFLELLRGAEPKYLSLFRSRVQLLALRECVGILYNGSKQEEELSIPLEWVTEWLGVSESEFLGYISDDQVDLAHIFMQPLSIIVATVLPRDVKTVVYKRLNSGRSEVSLVFSVIPYS